MGCNEVGARQAIAVEKDAVRSGAGANAAIADLAAAKVLVRMPHMDEAAADAAVPVIDQCFGIRSRTVIGHDHLEVGIGLVRERPQHRIKGIGRS